MSLPRVKISKMVATLSCPRFFPLATLSSIHLTLCRLRLWLPSESKTNSSSSEISEH